MGEFILSCGTNGKAALIDIKLTMVRPIGVRGGGSGGGAAAPQGLKNFRANFVFRATASSSKNPE